MPERGRNFQPYSTLGAALGRTYLHSKVRDVVLAAYSALETSLSGRHFVYGETGTRSGGRFRPHRTHQNGLSVDFMVPILDREGRSVPLPTNALNQFGYRIAFDAQGRYEDYRIDFEALAEHLYQLHIVASAQGVKIGRVIVEPEYHAKLFATQRGAFMRGLPLMKKSAWVRHDNHYHVDFVVPCLPMA